MPQKHFQDHYCLDDHLGIDDWDLLFLSNVRHINNWKREKPFGCTGSKLFTLEVLMRKRSTFIRIPHIWMLDNEGILVLVLSTLFNFVCLFMQVYNLVVLHLRYLDRHLNSNSMFIFLFRGVAICYNLYL